MLVFHAGWVSLKEGLDQFQVKLIEACCFSFSGLHFPKLMRVRPLNSLVEASRVPDPGLPRNLGGRTPSLPLRVPHSSTSIFLCPNIARA